MNKIIITGHGNYSTGMLSSIIMISGPKENIYTVDFLKDESDTTLYNNIEKLLNNKDNFLILCDLLGGSPYKQATLLSTKYKNIRVITGSNIGGVLDIIYRLDKLSIDELADRILVSSQKNLKLIKLESNNNIESTDGI